MKKLTREEAQKILNLYIEDNGGYKGYEIVDTYEDAFKAARTNEYVKTEMYVKTLLDVNQVTRNNLYDVISMVTIVLERYQ